MATACTCMCVFACITVFYVHCIWVYSRIAILIYHKRSYSEVGLVHSHFPFSLTDITGKVKGGWNWQCET